MIELNWADLALITIIALSSLISLKRGFVKEALSLASWVVAFIVARTFHPNFQTLLVESISEPMLRTIAAFVILFIGTLLLGAAISFIVGTLIRLTGLTPIDRLLGVVFGLIRGLILSVVIVAIVRLTPFEQSEWWQSSIMIENLSVLEQWSRSVFESHNQA
jgi:membrane protein required for colicin V production